MLETCIKIGLLHVTKDSRQQFKDVSSSRSGAQVRGGGGSGVRVRSRVRGGGGGSGDSEGEGNGHGQGWVSGSGDKVEDSNPCYTSGRYVPRVSPFHGVDRT